MASISNVLCEQIRTSDEDFESLRQALTDGDWELARSSVKRAVAGAERHMQTEEDVLFKSLEQMLDSEATTRPLREDHERIRELLTGLQQTIREGARSKCRRTNIGADKTVHRKRRLGPHRVSKQQW